MSDNDVADRSKPPVATYSIGRGDVVRVDLDSGQQRCEALDFRYEWGRHEVLVQTKAEGTVWVDACRIVPPWRSAP